MKIYVDLAAICFLSALVIFVIVIMYFTLKRSSSTVHASKYILNKFESDNTAPKLTEMIEFHKNNHKLSKYNVGDIIYGNLKSWKIKIKM